MDALNVSGVRVVCVWRHLVVETKTTPLKTGPSKCAQGTKVFFNLRQRKSCVSSNCVRTILYKQTPAGNITGLSHVKHEYTKRILKCTVYALMAEKNAQPPHLVCGSFSSVSLRIWSTLESAGVPISRTQHVLCDSPPRWTLDYGQQTNTAPA